MNSPSHPLSPATVFDLSGRTALVTGSSRGIGLAIAEGLAAAGADVITHATRIEAAESAASRIRNTGGNAFATACDLAVEHAGTQLIDDCIARTGRIDILVINASAQINATLDALTRDDIDRQIAVNLNATIELLGASLPPMADRGWGRVVSIGSINQYRPKPVVTVYAATKAAQHNLIQSTARSYARTGVVLNTLAPGLVDTDRNATRKQDDPDGWRAYVDTVNWMGRAAEPREMVGAAVFLASDACSFMTGETVAVSGGY